MQENKKSYLQSTKEYNIFIILHWKKLGKSMTTLPKMLKTILPRITHHLICQCKNPNNKSERLSLLMFILHQEGSFFYYPFFTDLFIVFLEYTYSINRFLLCSNTSSIICVQIFAVTDMSECPTQRLQMRQICRNIFSSSCYLIHLESSQ